MIPLTAIGTLTSASGERAARRHAATRPRLPQGHLFAAAEGAHLFLTNGSQIYGVDADFVAAWSAAMEAGDADQAEAVLARYGLVSAPAIDAAPLQAPPLRALSLAISQKCNLGCTYCYAQGGDFGGPARQMEPATALSAVERLFAETQPGDRVQLAFMGGEPLLNRDLLRRATLHAAEIAHQKEARIGFAITTNGTLLQEDDALFFERHGFSVTLSLDGIGAAHDRQRPYKNGRGSYETILARIAPLLASQRNMQVSARVTVTGANLQLPATLDSLIAMGFHSVGFSPLLRAPDGTGEMGIEELDRMLEQMIACGRRCEESVLSGRRYPFLNLVTALRELHRGTHRPYPCGAGAGYLGVSADGGLFACHRFVNDADGAMGSLNGGVDRERQNRWLAERHVHRQQPCADCWARYLCGGGCHHEVIRQGRAACDYIRGWLHYCLQAYVRLSAQCPGFFELPDSSPFPPVPGGRETD